MREHAAAGGEGAEAIAGRIVAFRNGVPTTVAPGLAAAQGAAGLIALSPAPDRLITATSFRRPSARWPARSQEERVPATIPGVIVEAGGRRATSSRPVSRGPTRVRLERRAPLISSGASGPTLWPRSPAPSPARPKIIIGTRYDSQLDSPGAADNATGPRRPPGDGPQRPGPTTAAPAAVVLVAFGVEEAYRQLGRRRLRHPPCRGGHRARWSTSMPSARPGRDPHDRRRPRSSAGPRAPPRPAQPAGRIEQELDAGDFPFADHAPFVAGADIPALWICATPAPVGPTTTRPATPPAGSNFTLLGPRTPRRAPPPPAPSPAPSAVDLSHRR